MRFQSLQSKLKLMYGSLAFLALAMLGYGLYAQHVQGFEPCPICYFQRLMIGALGLAWLLNALTKKAATSQLMLQLLLCISGATLAIRHLWIQTHPEVAKGSCSMGIQYMLDSYPFLDVVLKSWKGTQDCTDTSWRILGLTAPVWLIALFAGAMLVSILLYYFSQRKVSHSV
ncbi:MAG: disulfide bond formation protein B [Pseudomonadota bacterium]